MQVNASLPFRYANNVMKWKPIVMTAITNCSTVNRIATCTVHAIRMVSSAPASTVKAFACRFTRTHSACLYTMRMVSVTHSFAPPHSSGNPGSGGNQIIAPMPGRIVLVKAHIGEHVEEGQELLVMEAMKMELALKAPRSGTIENISATQGEFVEADAVLVRFKS